MWTVKGQSTREFSSKVRQLVLGKEQGRTTTEVVRPKAISTPTLTELSSKLNCRKDAMAKPASSADRLVMFLSCSPRSSCNRNTFVSFTSVWLALYRSAWNFLKGFEGRNQCLTPRKNQPFSS